MHPWCFDTLPVLCTGVLSCCHITVLPRLSIVFRISDVYQQKMCHLNHIPQLCCSCACKNSSAFIFCLLFFFLSFKCSRFVVLYLCMYVCLLCNMCWQHFELLLSDIMALRCSLNLVWNVQPVCTSQFHYILVNMYHCFGVLLFLILYNVMSLKEHNYVSFLKRSRFNLRLFILTGSISFN